MSEADTPDRQAPDQAAAASPGLSRRALLGAAAAGTAGLVIGGIAGPLVNPWPVAEPGPPDSEGSTTAPIVHSFFGRHQAGVTTAVQDHLHFAAFDMLDGTDRRDLARLLRDWSNAAARMTQGLQVGASDTGEAMDLPASGLTVTFGLGPGLFERDGVDRYAIAAERPAELEQLPPFVGDALKPASSDGDLGVQICADDPQVAVHALRNLSRIAASGRRSAGRSWAS
jgi:deferrochelatase/peroxidase EfeB